MPLSAAFSLRVRSGREQLTDHVRVSAGRGFVERGDALGESAAGARYMYRELWRCSEMTDKRERCSAPTHVFGCCGGVGPQRE